MAEEVISVQEQKKLWKGGGSPFKVSYGKLMMWYFLLSDAFTFSALLITYGAIRFSSEFWPDPNVVFSGFPGLPWKIPLGFVTLMTFILIMSSVFVVRAVQEGHRMNRKGVVKWMIWGIIGGLAFLGCQALEWTHLIHEGLSLDFNPFHNAGDGSTAVCHTGDCLTGPKAFGNLFFLITGFHGFHVFTGVVFNAIIAYNAAEGKYERRGHYEMVEKVGLYWHFVDLVWVFVFLAFYLL